MNKQKEGRSFPWRWLWHIPAWGLLWLAYTFLLGNPEELEYSMLRSLLLVSGQALLVYVNSWWLMPAFFFKKRYLPYLLFGLGLFSGVTYVSQEIAATNSPYRWERRSDRTEPDRSEVSNRELDPEELRERQRRERIRRYFRIWRILGQAFPFLIALTLSAVYEVTRVANQREQQTTELQREKLATEIKFLKSQTNPHFLFNALNNIYTLSVIGSEKAPDYLIKLSNLLRYMLYEADEAEVPLSREVEYLQDYIDLQLLKDSQGLNVETEFEGDYGQTRIAPLLLMPFVENAFKHSKVEDRDKGWIRIRLEKTDSGLSFRVENSLAGIPQTRDEVGGIGLQNVRRRLELQYPKQHDLTIEQGPERFSVQLKLELP